MQSIIRSSSNRVRTMRVTSENARSRKFAIKIGWAVFIVILMAAFVLTNLAMLHSFKEQPVYGFQRDERHALGVGPLLADMLKRRGFHKKPVQQSSKKAAGQSPFSNASMTLPIVAKDPLSNLVADTGADRAQSPAVDAESLKDDPLAMADEKLEESLKAGNADSEATADGLDADVLAAAGGDADLALAAEAEADSQEADSDQNYVADAAKLEASLEVELAKNTEGSIVGPIDGASPVISMKLKSSTTDQASHRLENAMDRYLQDQARQPVKDNVTGNVTANASSQPKPPNLTQPPG